MRTATLAVALASIAATVVLTALEFGATPLNSGPLGLLASALFAIGTVTLIRMPRDAVAGFGAALIVLLVHVRREDELSLAIWTAPALVVAGLAATIARRERRAAQRAAIHARIDEELVDSTRPA